MTITLEEVVGSHGPDDPLRFLAIADHFLTIEDLPAAAAALDRAYGLDPGDPHLARQRAAILDQLEVREHGLVWRYVPAGTFLMGSRDGDPDERPVHPRRLDGFWITDAPITWDAYCALLGWKPPPSGWPPEDVELDRRARFDLAMQNQMRGLYCKSGPGEPPEAPVEDAALRAVLTRYRFDRKPMVGASRACVQRLTDRLSTEATRYALPTEAQWEKAARGGLVGRRYAWGDEPPTRARCDFDHLTAFQVGDPRELPPNGYGLYGMCGGVAEWTCDVYDALAYHRARAGDLAPPAEIADGGATRGDGDGDGEDGAGGATEPQYVLRGGSWADCAEAVTVSFRAARASSRSESPTIGFRLVRAPA